MALQHVRSSTADKRPVATNLADGQIALNYNADTAGAFIKDSNNALVKIGPIHVGTTAPNATPAGSSGNSKGEGWLDTSGANPVLKIWNGTGWSTVNAVTSGTPVSTADTGTVTSAMIADSTIVNGDISASAAIAHSKLASITAGRVLLGNASNVPTATTVSGDVTISSTGVTAIGSGVVVNADINASAAIAHSKLASLTSGQLLLGNASNVPTGTAMSGDVTITNTGVTAIKSSVALAGSPTTTTQAAGTNNTTIATTAFVSTAVDAARQGLTVKQACRAATTANITLSGTQTVDGVVLVAGDRVLVKNQTTASQNGIYLVAASAWTRATDFDATADVTEGAFTFVEEGTTNADSGWIMTTDGTITIGTTSIAFAQFSGAGQITAGTGLSKTANTINIGTASSARIVVNADTIDLATTGVAANTYQSVTVDSYGRVTAGSNPTTLSGYGITDGVTISGNNAFTGANTFTNATGQIFRQAATQDGIRLRGRSGGTGSYSVEIVPTTLTASRTLTAPNVSGTLITSGDTGSVTSTMLADSIAGTKISPDFGSQAVSTTGTITGASLIPSGASVPANGLYLPEANTVGIATNSSARLRITSSGILTVGTLGEATTYDTYTRLLQVHGTGSEGLHLGNWGGGTGGGDLIFTKSKGGTVGTYGLCVDGDILGDIEFAGSDGTSGFNAAARIRTTAAGNHTSSVAGGVLRFYTTHSASGSTLKERMVLSNNGQLLLGTPAVASTQDLLYLNNRDATDIPIASHYSLMRGVLYTQEAMAPYDVWGVNIVTSYTDGASPYTINNLIGYRVFVNNTSGSNVTLTNAYGFFATAQVGLYSTNGYGFYSAIAAGANKWNFYAQGTAANYFEGEVRTNTALCYKTTVTAVNISFTIAASTLKGGIRTSTPTADITATVPTGTNMDSAFTSLATDHSIEWTYINLAAATYKVTITSNTDHTLVGDMVVPAATSARFLSRKTAENTFVTYRIA